MRFLKFWFFMVLVVLFFGLMLGSAWGQFVVQEDSTKDKIWWGVYNRPFSTEKYNQLMGRVQAFCQDEEIFDNEIKYGIVAQNTTEDKINTISGKIIAIIRLETTAAIKYKIEYEDCVVLKAKKRVVL